MSGYELSQGDLDNVTAITGLSEADLPNAFIDEFEKRIRLQHRLQPGHLNLASLIQLCRDFDMDTPPEKKTGESIRWQFVPDGSPVNYSEREQGIEKPGYFRGVVGPGTIAVEPKDGEAVLEIPVPRVTLRTEREPVERDKNIEAAERLVDWARLPTNTPVKHKNKKGTLQAFLPSPRGAGSADRLRIEVGGQFKEVPADEVVLSRGK